MAILTKGQTFANADSVTSTKLNNLVDAAAFVSGASGTTDDTSLEVNGSGRLQIKDSGVTSAKIDNGAVTTVKIADSNVTTSKILDANVTPAKLSQPLTLETAKATTSGTTVEFTGIPSWVKRITMILNGVSINGVNSPEIQIGSGSYSTSGYDTVGSFVGETAQGLGASNSGFLIVLGNNSSLSYGRYTLDLIGGNQYIGSGVFHLHQIGTAQFTTQSAGVSPVLAGPISQIRLAVVGGGAAFDAGSINIMYE